MINIDAIRARLRNAEANSMGSMHSACGEYNCDCHYEMAVVLDELEEAREEIEQLRMSVDRLLRAYLGELTREEIIELTVALSDDAARLRRELDDATGVIR